MGSWLVRWRAATRQVRVTRHMGLSGIIIPLLLLDQLPTITIILHYYRILLLLLILHHYYYISHLLWYIITLLHYFYYGTWHMGLSGNRASGGMLRLSSLTWPRLWRSSSHRATLASQVLLRFRAMMDGAGRALRPCSGTCRHARTYVRGGGGGVFSQGVTAGIGNRV